MVIVVTIATIKILYVCCRDSKKKDSNDDRKVTKTRSITKIESYCVARGIAIKHLKEERVLFEKNFTYLSTMSCYRPSNSNDDRKVTKTRSITKIESYCVARGIAIKHLKEEFCQRFVECIQDCAQSSLPTYCKSGTVVPGWNSGRARALKEKANFWYRVWLQAGCPAAGVLHQLKKCSKSRYKYEVRRLKRREQFIRRKKMAEALASSNSANFWQQVHRVNKSKTTSHGSAVDDVHGSQDIAELFATKFQSTLNSCDTSERDYFHSSLSSSLSPSDLNVITVSEDCVDEAFSHLKRGKADGTPLPSDVLILVLPAVRTPVASLFTAILRHGYMPGPIRDCLLVPIPKSDKDPANSDSYRPIALAPTLSKALEWCILLLHPTSFTTSGLQFGFKAKMSTTLCTGALKAVSSRYLHEGSPVFATFLDASKAFDLVNHEILFRRLLDKGLPVHLVRFFMTWYKDQQMNVRWEKSVSDGFYVSNGVRQGGVLSPILFTIYMDDLLDQLSQLGVGCFWESHYAGALCYADDLVLLAPSPSALRLMLSSCQEFALDRGLRFNATKTQLIRFSSVPSSSCSAEITFCGQQLPFVDTVTHLGHLLRYDLNDNEDINDKLRSMVRKANCLFASFPRVGSPILSRLFQSYCLSLYGSSLWSLSSPLLRNIEVAFNKILRRIWHLPNRCHTRILHLVAGLDSIFNVVAKRSKYLLYAASNCPSSLTRSIFRDSSSLCYTFAGYNFLFAHRHSKHYDPQYSTCATIIRAFRSSPNTESNIEDMIRTISCD